MADRVGGRVGLRPAHSPEPAFKAATQQWQHGLGGRFNRIVYWSQLLDWRNQTLTPNPDTLYFLPFFDPGLLTNPDGSTDLYVGPRGA